MTKIIYTVLTLSLFLGTTLNAATTSSEELDAIDKVATHPIAFVSPGNRHKEFNYYKNESYTLKPYEVLLYNTKAERIGRIHNKSHKLERKERVKTRAKKQSLTFITEGNEWQSLHGSYNFIPYHYEESNKNCDLIRANTNIEDLSDKYEMSYERSERKKQKQKTKKNREKNQETLEEELLERQEKSIKTNINKKKQERCYQYLYSS